MIIDTHSHLNFNAFKEDSDEVIKRTLAQDIWMVNVGTKYGTSQKAVQVAQEYKDGVFAAVGLHPMYAAAEFVKLKTDPDEGEFLIKEQGFNKEQYRELILSGGKKVVAVGEIGLDYYYKPKTTAKLAQFKEKQKKIFLEQMSLAKELDLPLILHCRMAHDDLIEILKSETLESLPAGGQVKLRGVVHCFTGTLEQAKMYIGMGFYIGLNGIIFKLDLEEVIKNIPLENMLVETDCPYLIPIPRDGAGTPVAKGDIGAPIQENGKRNEPIFIKHTIQKIAEIRNVSFNEICQKTTENAKSLFNIS